MMPPEVAAVVAEEEEEAGSVPPSWTVPFLKEALCGSQVSGRSNRYIARHCELQQSATWYRVCSTRLALH